MATVVTRTIGTASRDYSTLQSWEDAAPSNLVTSDQVWRGECYADTEFTAALTVSGSTVDSTRYKELTVAAGESFADHADKLTNALRYNASNGAALRSTTAWGTALTVSENYFRMSRLQVYQDSNNGNGVTLNNSNATVSDVIIESRGGRPLMLQSSSTLTNALVVGRKSSLSEVADIWNGCTVTNCTFAVPSDLTAATRVIKRSYWSGNAFVNCGFFGGTDAVSSATGATFTNCYTNDSTSIPSGCTTVAYDTSTGSGFENTTNGTHDYRIKSTSALKDAGTSTGAPSTDIVGTTRPQGGSYDVGVWEFAAGGGGYSLTVTAGGYTTSGNNVVLTAARVVQALAGSYAITGNNATLSSSVLLSALAGSYAYTGSDVGLTASRQLAVTAGSYAITGNVAGLNAARLLTATPGAYSISGNSVILTYNTVGSYALNVTAGSYSITGNDVALTAGRTLAVTPGAYAITGSDVVLTYGVMHTLNVTPGAYAITGYSAMLAKASTLQALAGAYAYTGRNVVLTYSGLADGVVDEVLLLSRITPEVQLLAELTQSVVLQSRIPD